MKTVSEPLKIEGIEYVWITDVEGNTATQTIMSRENYESVLRGLAQEGTIDRGSFKKYL